MKNQTNSFKTVPALTLVGTLLFSSLTVAQASSTVFSGSGANTASVFADFQAVIGGGSRIAWDGVRLDGTDANPNTRVIDQGKTVEIPVDRFRNVGAIYADPYAVSGDGFNSVSPNVIKLTTNSLNMIQYHLLLTIKRKAKMTEIEPHSTRKHLQST